MDRLLTDRSFVTGSFSIADAALFYNEHWMMARPAVQRALRDPN